MSINKFDNLIDPKQTAALMKELELGAKKRFGQNFLIDERILTRIIDGAGITKEDTVLEIGPGIGTMTQALAKRAGRVIAVEIDSELIPVLGKTLEGFDNTEVINRDILEVDISDLAAGRRLKVVANLPYYITTPIIMKLLEGNAPIESITVMVQKEVADRMQAAPGGKDYGALSVAVQYYTVPEILSNVPNCCFIPRPGVDSAVINLKLRENPEVIKEENASRKAEPETGCDVVTVNDREFMFKIVKAAFSQRRKTLSNTLKNDKSLGLTREDVTAALTRMGLSEDIRGERLSVRDFAVLSGLLMNK
ncbi:MAG: 16S rRNA (adenine(1518)-N(6)/adenine(1519)-N(6))-dimethyltransferase RsmA [Eubacteriales bacterium]|nr:16S rRNA (adenine(1518)-N(6)/adenine(1519)-N(6))-dimethyltransferase RsmA [Eubacteriales bacterium]